MTLASCVAETVFTGIGGGGFATYYDASTATTTCVDFFVAVPGLGGLRSVPPLEIAIDFGGQLVPYAVGPSTVAVPGVPAGVAHLHERWGRLPWPDVVQPAIEHAERGVSFAPVHAKVLGTVASAMLINEGAAVYGDRAGGLLPAGGRLFHPGLDGALRMLADDGPAAFYTGPIAEAMISAVGDQGDLGPADLAAYEVRESRPRVGRVRGGTGSRARRRPRQPPRRARRTRGGRRRGRDGSADGRRAARASETRRHDEHRRRRRRRERMRGDDEPRPVVRSLARRSGDSPELDDGRGRAGSRDRDAGSSDGLDDVAAHRRRRRRAGLRRRRCGRKPDQIRAAAGPRERASPRHVGGRRDPGSAAQPGARQGPRRARHVAGGACAARRDGRGRPLAGPRLVLRRRGRDRRDRPRRRSTSRRGRPVAQATSLRVCPCRTPGVRAIRSSGRTPRRGRPPSSCPSSSSCALAPSSPSRSC